VCKLCACTPSALQDESLHRTHESIDLSDWVDVSFKRNTPVQRNGFDCGIFMCKTADFLAQDAKLTFSQVSPERPVHTSRACAPTALKTFVARCTG